MQDEIMDALITNLRIPLPSTQSVASQQEIMFPVHLLAFLIIRQLSSKMTSHMVSTMSNVMREIQDFTIKFEDDYVSAFWLSNCHQLLCLLSTALDIDLVVAGKTQLPPFPRTPETLGALDKVRVDLDTLIGRIYQGWVKELKKRIASMIVPAVIENQSLPGYVCKQGGGIWGSWAKTSSAITISVDQLVNFLSKLNSTMKCYYLDDRICRQILTELIRVIGVSAFNHLIMRKNFCTWKRGVQIQYNVSRLEEFCTNQGIAEGMAESFCV